MQPKMNWLAILLVAGTATWMTAEGFTYLAVIPNNMRPNSNLVIVIKFNKVVYSEVINVKMFDRNELGKVISEKNEIVNGYAEVTVNLPVPGTISWGNYRVNITGTGGVPFKNSTLVYGSTKALSIFIQTDKAVYKPGDTVKYRVFTVNGALTPISPVLDIELFDAGGNKIDEKIGVSTSGKLVFEDELPLSDQPRLGSWRIEVSAPDFGEYAKETYRYDVKEYVLPKFEVTVSLPPYGLVTGTSLIGTVKAQYVFGKPVQGDVVLDVTRRYGTGFYDVAAARTTFTMDGETQFEIPKAILETVTRNLEYQNFVIKVNVTEKLTGITMAGSGNIQYHRHPYQLEFYPNLPGDFKIEFNPYKVLLKVTTRDGKPPVGVTEKVKVDISFFLDKAATESISNNITFDNFDLISPFIGGETIILKKMLVAVEADGTVKFDVVMPKGTATALIEVEFAGEKRFKQLNRFRSPGKYFLNLDIVNADPLKIGDTALVQVKNSKGAATAHYIVKSKSLIVKSGKFNIDASGNGTITLTVTREMAPSARIVVYYVAPTGEVAATGLNFIVEKIFQNKVTIEFDQKQAVEPKEKVNLKVSAAPGSLVSVLVVDKSVRLLKEGNDITQDRVSDEMRRYGDSPWFSASSGWGRILPWSFPGDDASDIFNTAQLSVLTDGFVPEFNLWNLRRKERFSSRRGTALVAHDFQESAPQGLGGSGGGTELTGQVRDNFLETWIWKTAVATNGVATFPGDVPDGITTYIGSAFALNVLSGLGVAPTPAELLTSLPLFINMQLPYGMVRGEVALIQANIFTTYTKDVYVTVTLEDSADFIAVKIDQYGNEVEADGNQVKCVLVKANKPTPVFFNIKPLKIKNMQISINATAASERRFDKVIRELPVKAEGEEKEDNIPLLIVRKEIGNSLETFSWPVTSPHIVDGSERARITCIGDVFGPSFKNLDKLIKLPYGCGEQNMINFAPSVYTAQYLNVTGRFDGNAELQKKILKALKTGYQRQLTYQRRDGSFSSFGNADDEGSLWLTSFVAKCFAQANKLKLIYMDGKVMDRAVNFIIGRQLITGQFNNSGAVQNKAMQGATASSDRVLTAYIVIALQEVKTSEFLDTPTLNRLTEALNLAIAYLTSEVNQMTTDYEKAICAYAFRLFYKDVTLPNDPATQLLTELENSPNKVEPIPGKTKYWKNPSHSLELEMASYILMTYTRVRNPDVGIKILNWLVNNRGPFGGYASTQDTVIAIQATSEFADLVYPAVVDMTVDVTPTVNGIAQPKITFQLNQQSQDILQYKDVKKFDSITVDTKGQGLAMIDANIFYNVNKQPGQSSYILTLTTSNDMTRSYVLKACAKYNVQQSKSNMALMEIGVLSGFEAKMNDVVKPSLVKRIEPKGSGLSIYFDEIPSTTFVCVEVPVQRVHIVSSVKPATVSVYSFYETSERTTESYIPKIFQNANLCSACGSECGCTPGSPDLPLAQCGIIAGY